MTEPEIVATAGRRVEVHGRIVRADGRVEELGLLAGREADGTPLTPDPRPVGVEHAAAVGWVEHLIWLEAARRLSVPRIETLARLIVDELFRYGPIVADGTPGARTRLTTQEGT